MTKYISILRGINVGGKRKILMADLKTLYYNLGFKNIETYIQSGNVIFESVTIISKNTIRKNIEQKINKVYDFYVPVILRTHQEIKNIIATNPLLKNHDYDMKRLLLHF